MTLREWTLAAILSLTAAVPQLQGQQSPEGVWTIVEMWGETPNGEWMIGPAQKQPSLIIFHDGYYSIAGIGGTAPRAPMPEGATRVTLSPEQAAAIWIPYTSNSGTYVVNGSTIITRPTVALLPNSMAEGTEFVFEFAWDGADLILTDRDDTGWYTSRLRRLR